MYSKARARRRKRGEGEEEVNVYVPVELKSRVVARRSPTFGSGCQCRSKCGDAGAEEKVTILAPSPVVGVSATFNIH